MKRLALLVSLVLLSVVGTTTTTQAYYLDTPHNESNGIYCYTCHYTEPFTTLWSSFSNPDPINDPDNTLRNAICLVCHAQGATHINRGPAKAVHGSSTADPGPPNYGNWTTECTQCHDVHSQGQMDYAGEEDAKLYLVTGTYALGASPVPWPNDSAGGLCNTVLAPTVDKNCGTTTIEIEPTVNGVGDWIDKTKWGNKGGLVTATAATDGSRGLVLVSNLALPDKNFEIISVDVTGTILKVKGNMLASEIGAGFGIIYGQSIRSFMMPNGGTTLEDMRDVKFFKPGLYLGDDGGYVDQTPGVTEPTGLCQVCHMSTKKWTADTVGLDAVPDVTHNNNIPCSSCHNVIAGGAPEVIQVHTTYIVSDDPLYTCACHGDLIADPDKHTTAGCATCHVTASPNSTNKMINSVMMTDAWLTGDPANTTVLGALLDSGYTMDYRLLDASGDTIISPTFDKIDCGDCHAIKRHQLMDETHGGHAATDFGWDAGGVCIVCHAKGANEVVADIHGNGVDGTCTICHDASYNRIGGEDGTAVGALKATSTCTSCHSYNGDPTPQAITSGLIHHSTSPINTYAQNGNCAFCHNTVGHKGDHLTGPNGVETYVNCNGCHNGNAATTTDGTPVDVAIDDPKVHDNCLVCHIVEGNLVRVRTMGEIQAPRGIVTAMPATGGTCFNCHGEYFNSHTINHSVFVQTTTNCSDCHDGAQGTTENIGVDLQSPDNPKIHDFCSSCHATNGLLKLSGDVSPGGVAQVMQGVSATCENCHTLGFNGFHQTVVHTNMVRNVTGNCDNCHTQAGAALNSNDGTRAGRLVHDTCATCHQNNGRLVAVPGPTGWVWAMPTNATYGGTDGGGTCTDCHGPFEGHITVSHVGFVATSASCNTAGCHPATHGDATGVPRNVATPDRLHDTCFDCHNANGTYPAAHDARVSAMPAGNNTCTSCHGTFTLASHNHTHLVSYNATNDKTTASGSATSCATCHNDAGTSLASWAAIYQEHLSSCDTCHSYTVGTSPPAATNLSIIQNSTPSTCVVCHTEKATGQADHSLHPIDFGKTLSCTTTCHTGNSVLVNIHGNGTAATCTMCHSATPATRNNEMIGASLNGIDGDCTPANGTAALNSWDTKDCLTCHSPGGNNPFSSTGGMHHVNKGGITDCTNGGCHSTGKLLHTTSVDTVADCNTCHDSSVGGSYARLASNKPYTAPGQVHDALACLACHALGASPGLGGILKTGTTATLNNNGTQAWETNGGTDGGGTCTTCHGAYFASHTNVDHTNWVGVTNACTTCHTGTMGNSTVNGPWLSASDNKLHDSCATCHQANGVLKVAPIGTTVDAMPTNTAATNDGGGVCIDCHRPSVFTFASHLHHTSYNETVYSSTIDRSQGGDGTDPNTACAICHKDKTGLSNSLDTFDGIRWEHDIWDGTKDATGGCTTCHDYLNPNIEKTGAIDTPVLGDVTTAISTTGTKYCTTCHVKKLWSNALSTHGGHAATDFAWDIALQNTCGASGCHDYAPGTNVVATIHKGDCTMCHTIAAGGDGTAEAGPAANGVDGSATLANVTTHTDNCLVCHPIGTYDSSTVHHDSLNNYAVNENCVVCHTGTTYGGNHTNLVSLPTNCLDCHSGGEGTSSGIALDATDGTVAARKLHDACITCHTTDADGTLKTKAGHYPASVVVQLMPAGLAGSGNGGGSCEACHTSGFTVFHQTIDHSGMVANATNCSSCHTATGDDTDISLALNDTTRAGRMVHDACTTCHISTSGRLVTPRLDSMKGVGNGGSDGGGNCDFCHLNNYFDNHVNINHVTWVGDTASCTTCHTNAKGTTTTAPTSPSDNKMHDTCFTCHDPVTGLLETKADANVNGWVLGVMAGGTCTDCHSTTYFDNHTHHTSYNETVYDSAIDRSQGANLASTACANCHKDKTGLLTSLDTWDGIRWEHDIWDGTKDATGGCETCHSYTDQPARSKTGLANVPPATNVTNAITTTGTKICTTCHVSKLQPAASSNHGTHPATEFAWTGTSGSDVTGTKYTCGGGTVVGACHAWTVKTHPIMDVHSGSKAAANSGNVCVNCHNQPANTSGGDGNTGPGTRSIGSAEITTNGGPASATNHTESCTVCHTLAKPAMHHVSADATSGNCIKCHMPKVGTQGNPIATRGTIMMPTNLACNFCHLWWPNNKTYVATNPDIKGYDTTTVSGKVMIYNVVFDPTVNLRQMATTSAVTSHAISTNTTTPINDYGACFACHGATGNGSNGTTGITNYAQGNSVGVADMIVPFHGLGKPLTTAQAGLVTATNQADFLQHVVNFYAGPLQVTENTAATPKNEPWNPGYRAFNWLAPEISMNPSGGTKPYLNSTKAYKSIHVSEYNTIYSATVDTKRIAALKPATSKASIHWNNWGVDLGAVGSRTFNVGVYGSKTKTTDVPLVPLNIPVNVVP